MTYILSHKPSSSSSSSEMSNTAAPSSRCESNNLWTPSIAPAGMAFLRSDRYGSAWTGQLFVASLKFRYLARLELDRSGATPRVLREHRLLPELNQRVRDVREGPDGLLYLLTDERDGRLLRLLPPG